MVTTADELGTLAEGKSLQQHRLEMGMEAHRVHCDGRHIALRLNRVSTSGMLLEISRSRSPSRNVERGWLAKRILGRSMNS